MARVEHEQLVLGLGRGVEGVVAGHGRPPGVVIAQRATKPPSTASAWPVTKLARSEHSQTTASAISCGPPSRPTGSVVRSCARA